MSVRSAGLMLACLFAVSTFMAAPALGQIRFLPDNQYNKVKMQQPKSVQMKLESMQASNDFEYIASFREGSRFQRLGKPIGRLKIEIQNSKGRKGTALCTASVISKDYILTNHHCIPGMGKLKVIAAKLEMDYLDDRNTSMVRTYKVDTTAMETSEKMDFSIVRVFGDPSKDYGTIRLSMGKPHVQDAVFIIHHPEGAPKTLSRKDCYVGALSGVNFIHSCDTLGGSSGSPVFSDESFEMVGLHFAGSREGNYGKQMMALRAESPILESIAVKQRPAGGSTTITAATDGTTTPPPPPVVKQKPRPKPVVVALDTQPHGAAIYFNGVLLGVTPHRFEIVAMSGYTFMLKKQGYATKVSNLSPKNGVIAKVITLEESQDQTVSKSSPPSVLDPATDQMNKALAFWDDIEKSGFLGTRKTPKGKSASPLDSQINKGNDLFKSMGK